METRILPAVDKRVETGPVKFGDDWTGLFIRGDSAFGLMMNLKSILKKDLNFLERDSLEGLIELLDSTNEHNKRAS